MVATMRKKNTNKIFHQDTYPTDERNLRDLTEADISGFNRMLKRLARDLNDPEKFEDMVKVKTRTIILRITDKPDYYNPLSKVQYHWTRRYTGLRCGHFDSFSRDDQIDPWDEQRCRDQLVLLRDFLNNKQKRRMLARVGPHAFHFCYEKGLPDLDYGPLIENHIPHCFPNSDWSITPNGRLWYHS